MLDSYAYLEKLRQMVYRYLLILNLIIKKMRRKRYNLEPR